MAIPGPPVMDEDTREEVRALMAKGFAGTVFLTTDDVRADYEELKGRGVEFTEEPEEPYLRDRLRLPRPVGQQPATLPAQRRLAVGERLNDERRRKKGVRPLFCATYWTWARAISVTPGKSSPPAAVS